MWTVTNKIVMQATPPILKVFVVVYANIVWGNSCKISYYKYMSNTNGV